MNNCPGRGPGPRPPWPRRARVAAVITVMAAAALLAAACGGSPSSTGSGGSPNAGGSANSPSAVAYSQCMRSHGVPNFPDPDSSGQIPKEAQTQQLGVSDSRFQAAQAACQRPVAVPGADPGPAAAAADRRPEVRPVHALPRGAELPRPHQFRRARRIRHQRQQRRL